MIVKCWVKMLFVFSFTLFWGVADTHAFDNIQCLGFYNPRSYDQLIAKENLSDLARYDGKWFEVVVPRHSEVGVIFEYRKLEMWREVLESFADVNTNERLIATKKLAQMVSKLDNVSALFKKMALDNQASMKARIKDLRSLRDKIINRSRKYALDNDVFNFEKIDDILGVRLMLPRNSELLSALEYSGASHQESLISFFTKKFGLSSTQKILKVEIKGGKADQLGNSYYRAIHITLNVDGVPVELQLMTKAMSLWHYWDHPNVYKAKSSDVDYNGRLKNYSQHWARLIRNLENFSLHQRTTPELLKLLKEMGLSRNFKDYSARNFIHWLNFLDIEMTRQFGIDARDRFLGLDRGLSLSNQKILARELVQLTLLQE